MLRSRYRGWLFSAALCWTVFPAAALDPLPSTLEESVQSGRVIWPLFLRSASKLTPDACTSLTRNEVRLWENGRPVEVTRLDREHRPLIHAILLDTSPSMRSRMEAIREAAVRYVRAVAENPGDDLAVVLTFDQDLILRAPLTRLADVEARDALVEAIRRIPRSGSATLIEAALFQLKLYLGSFAERSAVILLTDGESSHVFRPSGAQGAYVAGLDQVTLFPVGIDLPRGYVRYLGAIARRSGGRHYAVRNPRQAESAFDEIRRTLDQRAYVTYVPDRRSTAERVLTQVNIHSRDRRCRIDHPVVRRLRTDDSVLMQGRDDARVMQVDRDEARRETTISLELTDLQMDGGEIPVRDPLIAMFSSRPTTRTVKLLLPAEPGDRSPGRIEELFLRWMSDDGRPGAPLDSMIDGRSFLELRMQLAQRILDHEPALREQAERRMLEGIENDLERDLPTEPPEGFAGSWSELRQAALESALQARTADPTLVDRKRRLTPLAHWLGDLPARDLALRIEAAAANRQRAQPESVELWRERWGRLLDWLPRAGILTPLWLARDPISGEHGFYRIVYPRSTGAGFPAEALPEQPLGLLLLATLPDAGRVTGIDHAPYNSRSLPRRERRRLRRAGERLQRLVIELAGKPSLDLLVAIGEELGWRPYCTFRQHELLERLDLDGCAAPAPRPPQS